MSSGSLKNEFLKPHQLRTSQHHKGKEKAFKHTWQIMISSFPNFVHKCSNLPAVARQPHKPDEAKSDECVEDLVHQQI